MSLITIMEDDVCFFVTEKCNSNCIMCPMSEDSRKRGRCEGWEEWHQSLKLIPCDVSHITITGGEPFLEYEKTIWLISQLNSIAPRATIQILTNGRALCLPGIQEKLQPVITRNTQFAIPIHADEPSLHDKITRSQGSFIQSIDGLRFLSTTIAQIEIRIIGHALNESCLNRIPGMLLHNGIRIDVLNYIAMEMNGCAARNREVLWLDYRRFFEDVKPSLVSLVKSGVNVNLYNFPLCCVDKNYWTIAKNSISLWKRRYYSECDTCSMRHGCGGLFRSTFLLNLCRVHRIEEA